MIVIDGLLVLWSELVVVSGVEKIVGLLELLVIEEYLKLEFKFKEFVVLKELLVFGNKLFFNGVEKMIGLFDFMDGFVIIVGIMGKVGVVCMGDFVLRNGFIKLGIFLFDGVIMVFDVINRKYFL